MSTIGSSQRYEGPGGYQSQGGLGQKIGNVLGNAQKSGVNLSRLVNQAASVRAQHQTNAKQGNSASRLSSSTLAGMRSNYSAIHEFAQDQLTHISRKEFVDDRKRASELQKKQAKVNHPRGQTRESIRFSESVCSYVSTGDGRSSATKYGSQPPVRGSTAREPQNKQVRDLKGAKAMMQGTTWSSNCREQDCHRPRHKDGQCKHHFAQRVKKAFRINFKNMYRGPEQAFNVLDFGGKGYILDSCILGSPVMRRVKFSSEDAEFCFKMLNLFNNVSVVSALKDGVPPNGMSFDKFREIFFPQLHILDEENQSDEDRNVKEIGRQYSQNKTKQVGALAERVTALDLRIQTKISENYQTLRKAFLALDKDFDGAVTIEDFLHYFGTEHVEFDDLDKLLKVKDRNGAGRIDFTDFSKWFGNAIHKSEGFYFRHDSKLVNPPFDLNAQRFSLKYTKKDLDQCKQAYNENLIEKVVRKIYAQWKTMRKAFMEMDVTKTGAINPSDLRFYLKHWGVAAPDDKFLELFNYFDADGDGEISYEDFQVTAGKELQPDQGSYWRRDLARPTRIKSCKCDHCWHVAQDYSVFCKIHLKMMQAKALTLIQDIKKRLGSKWSDFISILRSKANPDDREQLFVDEFVATLAQVKLKLSPSQLELLTDAHPGRKEGQRPRLRVGRFYDISIAIEQGTIYKNLDVKPIPDGVEDKNGYTGQRHRRKPDRAPEPLSEAELIAIFLADNKMPDLMRYCREINPDQNGVVTVVEIDDVLRILYPEELEGRDLADIYEPFCSSNNKILLDYRALRDSINAKLKAIETNFQMPGSSKKQTPAGGAQLLTGDQALDGYGAGKNTPLKQRDQSGQNHVSSRGLVAVKALVEGRSSGQDYAQLRSGQRHSELAIRKKNSTLPAQDQLRLLCETIQEDISPYNDLAVESVFKPRARPASSAHHRDGSQNHKRSVPNLIVSHLNDHDAEDNFTRKGKSSAGLGEDAGRRMSRSELGGHGKTRNGQNRTTDLGRLLNSEGKLNPLQEIDEKKPFKMRVTSAIGRDSRGKTAGVHEISRRHSSMNKHGLQRALHSLTPSLASATGLQNSGRVEDVSQQRKDRIKAKVGYEWKAIFKNLSRSDPNQTGTVSKAQFQQACSQAGVSLSDDETRRVSLLFPAEQAQAIDYVRMSRELQLHYTSLNFVGQQVDAVENVKKVLALRGKGDSKQLNFEELRHLIADYQRKSDDLNNSWKSKGRAPQQPSLNKNISARGSSVQTTASQNRTPMQTNLLNAKIQEESAKRKKVASIIEKRRGEFIQLVQAYAKNKIGSTGKDGSPMIPEHEFRQICSAFGIKLSHQEMKRLVVNKPGSSLNMKTKTTQPFERPQTEQRCNSALKQSQEAAEPFHFRTLKGNARLASAQRGPASLSGTPNLRNSRDFKKNSTPYRDEQTRHGSTGSQSGFQTSKANAFSTLSHTEKLYDSANFKSAQYTMTPGYPAASGVNVNEFLRLYS